MRTVSSESPRWSKMAGILSGFIGFTSYLELSKVA
ncbi:hypothetical protein EVA_05196 [gut metagenome]|uniref:Uncharacterized protein n=1 Tax=gut metagenome TaxID=749906 RepID=J9GGY0_9ZZZZ